MHDIIINSYWLKQILTIYILEYGKLVDFPGDTVVALHLIAGCLYR